MAVIRPQPCDIDIYVLTETMPPGADVLAAFLAACDPRTGRPEGDEVAVMAATAVTVSATLHLWIDGAPDVITPSGRSGVSMRVAGVAPVLGSRLATGAAITSVKAVKGWLRPRFPCWSYSRWTRTNMRSSPSIAIVN